MKWVSRSEWGARGVNGLPTNITPDKGGTVIHYVGDPGRLTPKGHNECAGIVKGIQNYHIDHNGWLDIAYTLLVCQHGYVFEGRGIHHRTAANGTNTGNQNYYAICGLVDAPDTPSPDLIQGIKDGVAYLLEKGDAASKILGHRDIHSTDCPGDKLYHLVQNGTFKSGGNTGNAYPGSPIRVGASGGIVKKIQERLIALGFKLPKYGADGSFGQETEKAVEAFQEKNNLTKDGIVGSQTWGKLF